jgi:stage II sporulation protein D
MSTPSYPARLPAFFLAPLVVLVLALSISPTADAATTFNLVGRGSGHGIGLSAWGTYGYATKTDLTYKQILKHYYTGIGFGTTSNPSIRVLLNRGRSRIEISSQAQFTLRNSFRTETVPGDTMVTITWIADRKLYRVRWGDTTLEISGPITCKQGTRPLKLEQPNQNAGSAGMHYRGQLWVRHYDDGLTVVNKLALESYLRGVLPCEVYTSWPATALKTFAVAARTYTMRVRKPAATFDVYCTVRSQVYNGYDRERDSTDAAITATRGVIAKYDGQPILATYFSSSGGHTESIQYGWPGASPVPYLKGVSDPYETYDKSGISGAPSHHWPDNPIRMSAATMARKLGTYSSGNPTGVSGSLRAVYVTQRGTSPRVVSAWVIGSGGSHRIDGLQLRTKLALRSSWVYVTSMSLSASRRAVSPGGSATLSGRVYPARARGARVTLHIKTASGTTTRKVGTSRHAQILPSGASARYSTYSTRVAPRVTTTYWFSSGSSISSKVTVTVN